MTNLSNVPKCQCELLAVLNGGDGLVKEILQLDGLLVLVAAGVVRLRVIKQQLKVGLKTIGILIYIKLSKKQKKVK